jgi:hypothetical protein
MSAYTDRFYRYREHRGFAAAIALIALVMQLVAPHVPMPAMGGMTSWDMAGLELCAPSGMDGDGKIPAHSPTHRDCAVCTVLQQAGGTMVPADAAPPYILAYLRIERDIASDPQTSDLSAHVFSSRAPPLSA